MKILITSGLAGSDVGGPAQYGPNLREDFSLLGFKSQLISYGKVEKILPTGLRHLYFALKILPKVFNSNYVLALDTYSVGIPSVILSKIFNKKLIIRVGGDFLFSTYLNRTSEQLTLREFYENLPKLNMKERIIFYTTKLLMKKVNFLAFNTAWQKDIWKSAYSLNEDQVGVVRNFVPSKFKSSEPTKKNFLWAGRIIPEKNIDMIKRVSEKVKSTHPEFSIEIVTGEPREKILERLSLCYVALSPAVTDVCPNFIIEAISFNKPFLMTRESGLSEIFPKGGMFLDPKNEEEWKRAIEKMLEEDVYNKYKAELIETTYTHSWSEMAVDFINIWKKI